MKGGSSSTTTKEDITNVTTNTTTSLRDIGLTGDAAVQALTTLEAGVIARSDIAAQLSRDTNVELARGYNNLGNVVDSQLTQITESSERNIGRAYDAFAATKDIALLEVESGKRIASREAADKGAAANVAENASNKFVYITGAALAVLALVSLKR